MSTVKEFIKERQTEISPDRLHSHLKELEDNYNCFRQINSLDSLQKIQNKDKDLNGLPISVKDSICVQGKLSSAGSRILENYTPPFDATAVERAKNAGSTFIGKTNMDEFGFGTFSTNCAFETPKNPWDKERSAGGSSGGAAVVTSAIDYPHVALGQSTGGSISCPASFTGVVGLTPTYGLVSRYGLISYANSLDKIGPLGKSVFDVALMMDVIKGEDYRDQTTVSRQQGSLHGSLKAKVEGKKIGVIKELIEYEGVNPKVRDNFWNSLKKLEELGASYELISMPTLKKEFSIPAYYIISMAEASTNLAKYSGIRYGLEKTPDKKSFNQYFKEVRSEGFGQEAKRRILLGSYTRKAGYRDQYYLKALKVRRKAIEEYKEKFKRFDLLASPSMPNVAPKLSEIAKLNPIDIYAMDVMTVGPNLAGMPHLSLPNGFVKGLPTGLHLIGDHFQEQEVLNAGYALEKKLGLDLDPD